MWKDYGYDIDTSKDRAANDSNIFFRLFIFRLGVEEGDDYEGIWKQTDMRFSIGYRCS